MLELVEAMAAEEDGFPLVRAGMAYGQAFTRGGDYYGRPVNLASRITEAARAGSVLVVSPRSSSTYPGTPTGSHAPAAST